MPYEKRIALDPRLSTIAETIGYCDSYADIGCDHGRLGVFLLQRGWANRAILTDVSDASLEKARTLIRLQGLWDRVDFCVGDGIPASAASADAIAIAGMGGATIAGILERGRAFLGNARLILQANVAVPELRAKLCDVGYGIVDERIVRDGRRYYVVLEARPGRAAYDRKELCVGPILLKKRPEELYGYAAFRLRVARKALDGARNGREASDVAPLEEEIRIWEEVESWPRP